MPRSKSSKQEVAQLLEAIPLNQTGIANLLGVSPGLVTHWKTGRTPIGAEYLKELRRIAQDTHHDVDDEEQVDSDTGSGSQPYGEWLAEQLETLKTVSQLKLAERAVVNPLTISNLITGKTENPQKDTRHKIEEALQGFYREQKPRQEASKAPALDSSKPVVGVLYNDDEIKQVPNKRGVYVIHDKRGWPTYVGKGNLLTELKLHHDKKWATREAANKFSYAIVDHDPDEIETIIIKFMADSLLVNKNKKVSVAEKG
jgi:transcriptional regulator with XRE-family HTH domain